MLPKFNEADSQWDIEKGKRYEMTCSRTPIAVKESGKTHNEPRKKKEQSSSQRTFFQAQGREKVDEEKYKVKSTLLLSPSLTPISPSRSHCNEVSIFFCQYLSSSFLIFPLSAPLSLSLSIFPKITKWLAQLKVYEEKSMVIKLQIFSAPPTHHCWQNTTEESAHSKGDHLHGKIGSSILSLFLLFSWLGLAHRLFCQPFFLLSGQKNMNRSVAGHRSSYHFPPYLFISYIIIFLARSK